MTARQRDLFEFAYIAAIIATGVVMGVGMLFAIRWLFIIAWAISG